MALGMAPAHGVMPPRPGAQAPSTRAQEYPSHTQKPVNMWGGGVLRGARTERDLGVFCGDFRGCVEPLFRPRRTEVQEASRWCPDDGGSFAVGSGLLLLLPGGPREGSR